MVVAAAGGVITVIFPIRAVARNKINTAIINKTNTVTANKANTITANRANIIIKLI